MKYTPHRSANNPIIHAGLDESIGANINGPSLIRVPDWLPNPLGRFYLYFGHHGGEFIRLAYADDVEGPWTIHRPGTLRLEQTRCFGHVASPDLHIDHDRRELIMYFHGPVMGFTSQCSLVATSSDGVNFKASEKILGPPYFRVFQHEGARFAIAMARGHDGGGMLLRSDSGRSDFEEGPTFLPRQRHSAILKKSDSLDFFFSRGLDCPERILHSEMKFAGDWRTWTMSEPKDLLLPEEDYEGGDQPLEPSDFGAVHEPVRQLRDPGIFADEGRIYLLYSCAGETALGLAELRPA